MPLEAVDSGDPTGHKIDRRLRIGVFGPLLCNTWDGASLLPRRRKSRGLLAYLALARGRPVARSRAAGLLWDRNTEDQARTSLRQALVDVTASLLPAGFATIEARRDDLVLRPEAYVLDLSVFDQKPPLDQKADDGSFSAPLPTAALLEDLDGLSESFDHFLAEERVRADHLRLRWHEARLKSLDPQSDPEARLRVARALLAVDLAHEQAWRVAIRAQADLGDIGQALQQFRECEAALSRLLDARPSAETITLIDEIKRRGDDRATGNSVVLAPRSTDAQELAVTASTVRPMVFDAPSVAILPLRWLGPDEEERWLSEGITDDVVSVLSGIREPVVISNNSSRQFDDRAQPRDLIADRLGADYLVTGSIRKSSDRVRISISLEESRSGATVWAETYAVPREGLFDAQTEIAAKIAHALSPKVQAQELRRSLRHAPENLGAYHLMLRAKELMFSFSRVHFDEAGALLQRAAAIDPSYAGVHSVLAHWHMTRLFQGWSEDWAADSAAIERAAEAALRLEPDHARTLALLGHTRVVSDRRLDEALPMLDRAFNRAQNDTEVLCWTVPGLSYGGRAKEAIARAHKAILLSPHDPFRFRQEHYLSVAYYANDDFEEAVHWGELCMEKNENYTANIRTTIGALVALDRLSEAKKYADKLKKLPNFAPLGKNYLGPPYIDDRKRKEFLSQMKKVGISL